MRLLPLLLSADNKPKARNLVPLAFNAIESNDLFLRGKLLLYELATWIETRGLENFSLVAQEYDLIQLA